MSKPTEELSVRELRAELADVINAAGMTGQVTFVTSRGRRVAGVVSVDVAENAAAEAAGRDGDALTANMYAINVVLLDDKGGIPGRTMAEIFEEYAGDVLHDLGGSPARCIAAAQEIARSAARSVRYPMLWRQAACAVELCQRAVEIAGEELPGGYRPGSRMSKTRR